MSAGADRFGNSADTLVNFLLCARGTCNFFAFGKARILFAAERISPGKAVIGEASFVQYCRAMNRQDLTTRILTWSALLIVSAACRSLSTPEERTPIREDPGGRESSPVEELTLIRADSEIFGAVVRAQLNGKEDEYPRHLDKLRYDARPYGTASGYPEVFAGVEGVDPTLSFG